MCAYVRTRTVQISRMFFTKFSINLQIYLDCIKQTGYMFNLVHYHLEQLNNLFKMYPIQITLWTITT